MRVESGLRISDESWVPIKWIYALIVSCVVSLATISGGIWYIAAVAFKADDAVAKVAETNHRLDLIDVDRKEWATLLRNIDTRLSHIEGAMRIKQGTDE